MGLITKIFNSPNKYNGRYNWKPDVIVDHITAGSASSAVNTFMNKSCEVSSNFIVAQNGEVYQMVDIKDGAWCNGTSTGSDDRSYKVAKSALVRSRATNANNYTVSIEHENYGGGNLTEPQLAASIALHIYIIQKVKEIYGIDIPVDRDHIIGHYQISNRKPLCPGPQFPWDRLIEGIKNGMKTPGAPNPATPVPVAAAPVVENATKFYKVQCGAFTKSQSADKLKNDLIAKGYKSIVIKSGLYFKVQCGAFTNKGNADKLKDELVSKGYQSFVVYE